MNKPTLQTSQMLARLIGPVLCVIALGMLTSRVTYRDMAAQFVMTLPLIDITGVLLLTAGLAILNAHNAWTPDWRGAITGFGWFITIVGAFRVIAPPYVAFIASSIFRSSGFFIGAGIVFLSLGALLTFKGYVSTSEINP